MNPDEARELFSEAFEDDLEEERRAAFDALLAEDDEVRSDYEGFVETLEMMGQLGAADAVDAPNLLPRIQERIRRRSRGRYYRDRFSRRTGVGWTMSVIVAVAVLVILAITWIAIQTTVPLEDEPAGSVAPVE